MTDTDETISFALDLDTRAFRSAITDADALGQRFSQTLTSAFDQVAVRGRKLDDVIRGVGLRLSQMAFDSALKPITSAFGNGIGQALSGLTGFASGGVPGRQMPVPFASGGVVTAPTAFSFGSGQLGVMGEAGAEAILPLARGADGRLGVRGGGRSVAVTFNVSTPDAESFKSSEAQVGALLSRVIARGERNL
ncbi:MAG: phage tail tape measure protein [Pseudomonadota bacterium]